MKIRWMALAILLAVAMTGLAALSTRSTGNGATSGVANASGCPAVPKPANLDFTLKDMYGRDVKLSEYRGKVVLLNFWATWCPPCLAEMPGFVDLQAKYKTQGLEVLGVSVSDAREDLPPFAKAHNINYPLLVGQDHDDLINAYDAATAIPVSVIIGRTGTICDRHMGLADLEQLEREIKALL